MNIVFIGRTRDKYLENIVIRGDIEDKLLVKVKFVALQYSRLNPLPPDAQHQGELFVATTQQSDVPKTTHSSKWVMLKQRGVGV